MLPSYDDIIQRMSTPPLWYDSHGVPRYEPFRPEMLGVYEDFAVYYRIACQDCGVEFHVATGSTMMRRLRHEWERVGIASLAEREKYEANANAAMKPNPEDAVGIHYGDPPRHRHPDGGRCAGETMNCDDLEVLEVWTRANFREWERHPEVEVKANEFISRELELEGG